MEGAIGELLGMVVGTAVPIDDGISVLGAPVALGGVLVAVLILSPESLAAVRAALATSFSARLISRWEPRFEHQPDDPGCPHHRLHSGQNDYPRTRCR